MQGSLGEKVGEGCSADIHAWAPGQVVKLFKPGVERRLCRYEAQMTRAAFAAGLPAPEVFDDVTLEGRFGIVLSRFEGPTLLQLLRTRALTPEQAGGILAALSISVHKTPPPPDVISLRDLIQTLVQSPGNLLPKHLATGVLALLESLPPGRGLCHGDILPSNVIRPARRLRHDLEPQLGEIEVRNECLDRAHRIALADVVVETLRQQRELVALRFFDEPLHDPAPAADS